MNVALPRRTYMTKKDAEAEERIADRFAKWSRADHAKIGQDKEDELKPRIDRALLRGNVITAFFEVKQCGYAFSSERRPDGWSTALDKIEALRQANALHRVHSLMVVEFACGTLAYVDSAQSFEHLPNFGRTDRGDPADMEEGARFKWAQFRTCDARADDGWREV
jgi:hypothetical protein